MRSIALLAAVTGTLMLTSACSDDGGSTPPPDNAAPVADFTAPSCTAGAPCEFASTSTDDVGVTSWSWDFNGDGTADANTATVSFTYPAAGSFDVTLTVRDAGGLSGSKTKTVTVGSGNNAAPVADFVVPACTMNAPCDFASTSTDDVAVTEWSWDFNGDGTVDATTENATFTYTTAGTFNVSLTVKDAQGLSNTRTTPITIAPLVNTPPSASFTFSCNFSACSFTSTSTDVAPGTIVTYAWTFGDAGTAAVSNPLHTYAITGPRDFTVTLTVTDNEGATDSETQTVSVAPAPPTAEGCVTSSTHVDCALNITERSIIKLKLLGLSCGELSGERVVIPAPIGDQVFLNVCTRQVGDSTRIFGGPEDKSIIFEPGSQAVIRFVQGTAGPGDEIPGPPSARLTGTFPEWTINFEDGANPGAPGEPDFADVVLGVTAAPAP